MSAKELKIHFKRQASMGERPLCSMSPTTYTATGHPVSTLNYRFANDRADVTCKSCLKRLSIMDWNRAVKNKRKGY